MKIDLANKKDKNIGSLDSLLIRIWRVRDYNFKEEKYEQLGLLYLATYAKQQGYSVMVYDPHSLSFQRIYDKIQATCSQVVGFYCDHDNVSAVCQISKLLKDKNPQLILIAGGPQASAACCEVMSHGYFDALVRGEGEIAYVELLNLFLKNQGDLKNIQGITYWKEGELTHNQDHSLSHELDILPFPDRSLSENNAIPDGCESIISGRGCPYNCAFCAEGIGSSKTYRYRSPKSVLKEIDYLIKERELKYLLFMDDTFIASPSRAIEISRGIKEQQEEDADFRWFCEARADIICHNPELLKIMKNAGLARIQIGLESGNQYILDAYHKGVSLKQIRTAIQLAVEANIPSIVGNFIIGGAYETQSSIAKTIDFAQELIEMAPGRIDLSATYLTPYPATAISQRPQDYGVRIIDSECFTGACDRYCFVETEDLNKWEIIDAYERFVTSQKGNMLRAFKNNSISDEIIAVHFLLLERYNIMTQWVQIYLSIKYISNYFGLLLDENYSCQAEIPHEDLPNWFPVRTCPIGPSNRGKLVIELLDGMFEFDEIGTMIYEHCSGHSSLMHIVQTIKKRLFKTEIDDNVYTLVLAFLGQLEQKHLIIWARI